MLISRQPPLLEGNLAKTIVPYGYATPSTDPICPSFSIWVASAGAGERYELLLPPKASASDAALAVAELAQCPTFSVECMAVFVAGQLDGDPILDQGDKEIDQVATPNWDNTALIEVRPATPLESLACRALASSIIAIWDAENALAEVEDPL